MGGSWLQVCLFGGALLGGCAVAAAQGLDGGPLVSARGAQLAGDVVATEEPQEARRDLSGVWAGPDGEVVLLSRSASSEGQDGYTVRLRGADGGEVLLQARFDGRTLTTWEEESALADGVQRRGAAEALDRLFDPSDDPAAGSEEQQEADPLREGSYRYDPEEDRFRAGGGDPELTPLPLFERRHDDRILLLGMNHGSPAEVDELRGRGAETLWARRGDPDVIQHQGQAYDLRAPQGRAAFLGGLGLSAAAAGALDAAFAASDEDSLDELGQLVAHWSEAERGGVIPGRLVLSGHHVGDGVWGDDNGELSWETLEAVAAAMPRAAAQVEHLHISACYSGGRFLQARYEGMFPSLKTLWAYTDSAPGAASGSTAHLRYWERATRRGAAEVVAAAERMRSIGSRKADSIYAVAVGEQSADARALGALLLEIQGSLEDVNEMLVGERPAGDSQSGPLREFYGLVQQALQVPELGGEERSDLERIRDQAIRLLYYDSHVAPRFAQEYADELAAGYRAAGLELPDYARLGRAEIVEAAREFNEATWDAATPETRRVTALLYGLLDLDPRIIPERWI